jgi:hypothetical protein
MVLSTGVFALLIITPIAYDISSLLSRIILVVSLLLALCSVTFASLGRSPKLALISLSLSSSIFLLWRFSLLTPVYVERALSSEGYVFALQYGEAGRLTFSSVHSYFFGPYLTLYVLQSVTGLSGEAVLYCSVLIYGIIASLVATIVLQAIWRIIERTGYSDLKQVLGGCFAFLIVSIMYTARSAIRAGFPQYYGLVVLMAVWFVIDRGLRRRSDVIVELSLVVGLTLGAADGILLMVPFLLLFSMFWRKSAIAYALIPLAYMTYTAYSYLGSLLYYWQFAWVGFTTFVAQMLSNDISARIFPFGRILSITREDAYVASVTYLSFIVLCLTVVVISTLVSLKHKTGPEEDAIDVRAGIRSASVCLWLFLVLAGVIYVGASISPENFSSDIRSLAIVLPAGLLLVPFMSTRFMAIVSGKKALAALMVVLIILGSLNAIYTIYPKSALDPVNVAEDDRTGSTSIIAAANYIIAYGGNSKVIADYKLLNLAGTILGPSRYQEEQQWFGNLSANGSLNVLHEGGILAFSTAGIFYPSIYQSPEAYAEAYNFSLVNNRIYDNGAVIVVLARD